MTRRLKDLMAHKFDTCRLLGVTHDPYRDREVRLFAIPGDFTIVGICDGTDSWVAPVSAKPFSRYGIDVEQELEKIRNEPSVFGTRARRERTRLTLDEPKLRVRKRLNV